MSKGSLAGETQDYSMARVFLSVFSWLANLPYKNTIIITL